MFGKRIKRSRIVLKHFYIHISYIKKHIFPFYNILHPFLFYEIKPILVAD